MFVVQGGVLDMSCYMYIEEKNSLQVYATTAYRIIKKSSLLYILSTQWQQ